MYFGVMLEELCEAFHLNFTKQCWNLASRGSFVCHQSIYEQIYVNKSFLFEGFYPTHVWRHP